MIILLNRKIFIYIRQIILFVSFIINELYNANFPAAKKHLYSGISEYTDVLLLFYSTALKQFLTNAIYTFYQILESTAAFSMASPFIYLSINALKPSTPSCFGSRVLPSFPANTSLSRKSSKVCPSFLFTR